MKRALLLVCLVLASLPAGASAETKPSSHLALLPLRQFHLIRIAHRRSASCSAHTRTGAVLAKVARRMLPVACEQPPRSWLRLNPAQQAAAALSP